jgi:hypothetical protein
MSRGKISPGRELWHTRTHPDLAEVVSYLLVLAQLPFNSPHQRLQPVVVLWFASFPDC